MIGWIVMKDISDEWVMYFLIPAPTQSIMWANQPHNPLKYVLA